MMLSQETIELDMENLELAADSTLHSFNNPALSNERTLQILYALHGSLSVQQVMQTFAHYLHQDVKANIHYKSQVAAIEINTGAELTHRISYQLANQESDCGEIIFTRDDTFTDDELSTFEDYLCLLIVPLRNAIEHELALQSAMHDPLTGIGNRNALTQALNHEVEMGKRHAMPLSVLALDLDYFKQVNDTYGHLAGDALLQHFSQLVNSALRTVDHAFRVGGEEFIILLTNTETAGAVKVADRIRKLIAMTPCMHQGTEIKATVSIGLASYINGDTDTSLLQRADEALYRAKAQGRNCVCN